MNADCRDAISFFLPGVELRELKPLGQGNVNDTWFVGTTGGADFVLQQLNPTVFPDPGLVQDNLCTLTRHLQHKVGPGTAAYEILQVHRNPDAEDKYRTSDGACWRLCAFINNTRSLNTVSTVNQARGIGRALGWFHQQTSSLDPASLADTLPGFHVTPLYLARYDELLAVPPDTEEAADCRDFIQQHRAGATLLDNGRKRGIVREQVIHGDPKVANFLFSRDTRRVVSLIDLDTVKPGLLLHDISDCLRSCCNPRGENITSSDTIIFEQTLFTAMLEGYLSRAAELLLSGDTQLLVDSVHLICFELGLRFYTDYLAGNSYFRVGYPAQNLFRARVQFALACSIENQYSGLQDIWKNTLETVRTVSL